MGLQAFREARVLSQRELARRAGVSQTTINNIEGRKLHPRPQTIRKLAAALEIAPDVLARALRDAAPEGGV